MVMRDVVRIRAGRIEAAAAVALYGVYELVRGLGGEDWDAARLHTSEIVAFERSFGMFWERSVQDAALGVPGLARILGVLYITLHFAVTIGFLAWVHRRRPDAFARVRTAFVTATGIALVGYVLYPAAPPRLANLGFADSVVESAGINLSSDMLGALYNPIAAVPSLHFGYALLVGIGLVTLGTRRWVRIAGALYPLAMLIIIVATGNHFFVDAMLGGLVVVTAWFVARALVRESAPQDRGEQIPAYA
jgi:hypothetical protein